MKYTLVARGPKGKGVRWMFEASDATAAHRRGVQICRRERLDFVAVFVGHMAALRVEGRDTLPRLKLHGEGRGA